MGGGWRPSWEQAGVAVLAAVYLLFVVACLLLSLADPDRRLP